MPFGAVEEWPPSIPWIDAEVVEDKGVNVRSYLQSLGGAAGAMPRLRLDANQDRVFGSGLFLQRRSELE